MVSKSAGDSQKTRSFAMSALSQDPSPLRIETPELSRGEGSARLLRLWMLRQKPTGHRTVLMLGEHANIRRVERVEDVRRVGGGDDLDLWKALEQALQLAHQLHLGLGVKGLVDIVEQEDSRTLGTEERGQQRERDECPLTGAVGRDIGGAFEVDEDLVADPRLIGGLKKERGPHFDAPDANPLNARDDLAQLRLDLLEEFFTLDLHRRENTRDVSSICFDSGVLFDAVRSGGDPVRREAVEHRRTDE